MNAAPAPVDLAAVLARGDIWRGDALASLTESGRIVVGQPVAERRIEIDL